MRDDKFILKLERQIKTKMKQIEKQELAPAESGMATLFKTLQGLDEASYLKHISAYKTVLLDLKANT